MAGAEKESFWERHLVALIVGGFAVLLLVIVVAASLVISSLITSGALATVYFVDRHRRKGGKGAEPTDAGAQPAPSSSTAARVEQ